MDDKFPTIPHDLMEELEKRFPEMTPPLTMSLEEIRWKGGQRSVVRFLRSQYDRQNETVINQQVLNVS